MSEPCTGQHTENCPWCDTIRIADEAGVELVHDTAASGEPIELVPGAPYQIEIGRDHNEPLKLRISEMSGNFNSDPRPAPTIYPPLRRPPWWRRLFARREDQP